MSRSPLVALTALLVLGLGVPGPAQARSRPVLLPLVSVAPASTSFRDRVIPSSSPAGAHAAALDGTRNVYMTKDGTAIPITIASSFTGDPAVAQTYADFLDTLPHGSELADLNVTIVPSAEVNADCGGQEGESILACYSDARQRMIVPGDLQATAAGVTASYVIAHEYGHHVAAHRSNAPLNAGDYGPKRWSSYELVCLKTDQRQLFPGNEAIFYHQNPGENWAETYARLVYPQQPWSFSSLLAPDTGAFVAARADVMQPWTTGVTRRFRGTFTAGGPGTRSFKVPLTLDGALKFTLSGPKQANNDLRIVSLGKVQAETHAPGSSDHLSYRIACRQRRTETLTLKVLRRSGSGPFTLTARYAG
jgi:hypothetical protein